MPSRRTATSRWQTARMLSIEIWSSLSQARRLSDLENTSNGSGTSGRSSARNPSSSPILTKIRSLSTMADLCEVHLEVGTEELPLPRRAASCLVKGRLVADPHGSSFGEDAVTNVKWKELKNADVQPFNGRVPQPGFPGLGPAR